MTAVQQTANLATNTALLYVAASAAAIIAAVLLHWLDWIGRRAHVTILLAVPGVPILIGLMSLVL